MSGVYAEKLSRLWDEKDRKTIESGKQNNMFPSILSPDEERRWEQAVVSLYESLVREKSARGVPAAEGPGILEELGA